MLLTFLSATKILNGTLLIVQRDLPGVDLILQADRDAYQSRVATGDNESVETSFLADTFGSIDENRNQVTERVNAFKNLFDETLGDDPIYVNEVRAFNQKFVAWSGITDRVISDISSGRRDAYLRAWESYHGGDYDQAFDPMREHMDILTRWIENLSAESAAELRDRQKAVSDRLGDMGNETRKLEKSSAQLENEVGRFKVDSISET